jgi:hypothetical protein
MPKLRASQPFRPIAAQAQPGQPMASALQSDWAEFTKPQLQLWLVTLAIATTYGLYLLRW